MKRTHQKQAALPIVPPGSSHPTIEPKGASSWTCSSFVMPGPSRRRSGLAHRRRAAADRGGSQAVRPHGRHPRFPRRRPRQSSPPVRWCVASRRRRSWRRRSGGGRRSSFASTCGPAAIGWPPATGPRRQQASTSRWPGSATPRTSTTWPPAMIGAGGGQIRFAKGAIAAVRLDDAHPVRRRRTPLAAHRQIWDAENQG